MSGDRRVLVVDDDRDIVDALGLVLETQGYSVMTATNGAEALERLRSEPNPCVILLDLMMPVMNGWEFRNAQLADATLARIPVVVVTGDGRAQQKAADLQAADYLAKPVELEVLLATVAQYASRHARH